MKRHEATVRLVDLLKRAVEGRGEYLPRLQAVYVFGSYARGSSHPHDLDLLVDLQMSEEEKRHWPAARVIYAFDHLGAFRRELVGSQRVISIHYTAFEDVKQLNPVLLWKRGETIDLALERLHRIREKGTARSYPCAVHPKLEPVVDRLPRNACNMLSLLSWAKWISVETVELPRVLATHQETVYNFACYWAQWNRSGREFSAQDHPRFATAHAAAAYLEKDGIAPLHAGSELSQRGEPRGESHGYEFYTWPPTKVYFGVRGLQGVLFDLGEGSNRLLYIINYSARVQPLVALDVRSRVDPERFKKHGWYDGLLRRYARARKEQKLPLYMDDLIEALNPQDRLVALGAKGR